MTAIYIVGTSRYAVDAAGVVEASLRATGSDLTHLGFLAVEGEERAADPVRTSPFAAEALNGHRIVVAVADPHVRTRFFAEHLEALRQTAINIVHPSAVVADGCRIGIGNLIGPHCYLGADARLGDLNVLAYHVGIGHHARLGDGNFVAPGFQCGGGAAIGDFNFFGLSCTVGPGITIGSKNRFQAGTAILQPIASDLLCYSSERLKAVQLPGPGEANVQNT